MSEKKSKPRVIHVDKLVIHADEVVIVPKRQRHDPWLFRIGNFRELDEEEVKDTENRSDNDNNDHERRPFSWV